MRLDFRRFAFLAVLPILAAVASAQVGDGSPSSGAGEQADAIGGFGYLGVLLAPGGDSGAVVTGVMPGGPAERAGLRPGDVLIAGGPQGATAQLTPIRSDADAQAWLRRTQPDDYVTLTYLRRPSEFEQSVAVTLGERPAPVAVSPGGGGTAGRPGAGRRPVLLGVTVGPTPVDLRARWQVPPPGGAYVLDVVPGFPAAAAGIPSGAIIWAVNGQSIGSPQEFGAAIQAVGGGESVTLSYYYGSRTPQRVPVNLAAGGDEAWRGRAAEANDSGAAAGSDELASLREENLRLRNEIQRLKELLAAADANIADLERRLAASAAPVAPGATSESPAAGENGEVPYSFD